MEVKEIIYVMGGIVSVVASHFALKTKIEVVESDLKNHKENHGKLEQRVSEHESKIDQRLEKIDGKIDGLRDLILDKMK